jgi:hypothetical protein
MTHFRGLNTEITASRSGPLCQPTFSLRAIPTSRTAYASVQLRAREVRRYPTEVGPMGNRRAEIRSQIAGVAVLAVVGFSFLSRSTAR